MHQRGRALAGFARCVIGCCRSTRFCTKGFNNRTLEDRSPSPRAVGLRAKSCWNCGEGVQSPEAMQNARLLIAVRICYNFNKLKVYRKASPSFRVQDNLYFESNNQAIALLDYDLVMERVDPGQDCVLTPKGITQCIGPGL